MLVGYEDVKYIHTTTMHELKYTLQHTYFPEVPSTTCVLDALDTVDIFKIVTVVTLGLGRAQGIIYTSVVHIHVICLTNEFTHSNTSALLSPGLHEMRANFGGK